MKLRQNKNTDDSAHDDGEIRHFVNRLPDPGPARIANAVMRRIRQRKEYPIRVRPSGIAWGLAGSLAGLFLGIWLAGALPERLPPVAEESYDAGLIELNDEIDRLVWEISYVNGVEP